MHEKRLYFKSVTLARKREYRNTNTTTTAQIYNKWLTGIIDMQQEINTLRLFLMEIFILALFFNVISNYIPVSLTGNMMIKYTNKLNIRKRLYINYNPFLKIII
ncbi:hypothetical protein [Mycoplasma sp. P36-A1]|uniref:hypothetical protein n=1 Tax=Mycoplasma sp. P36-A1 TaxID=3252900 RepID=UPI003C2BB938